jgi:signal recognition particle receptor subunit beta
LNVGKYIGKIQKDHIQFLVFLAITIILTKYLMDIIIRAWKTDWMIQVGNAIKTVDPSGTSIFINIIIGFYIGSLIFISMDRYKRIQALILFIGIFIVFNYLSEHISIKWNVIYIGLGILIGSFLATYGDIEKVRARDLGRATKNVSIASMLYIIIAFFILYVISPYQSNINFVKDAVVILAFSYFFGEVMNYKAKGPKILVLGPASSGKTAFLAGCYLRILSIAEIPAMANDDLVDLIDELAKGVWPDRTRKISKYQFRFETGKIFPKETLLRTIDYPGIYLENILDFMYTKKDVNKMNTEEKNFLFAAKEVTNADRLIFIIDGEKYPRFEEMGTIYYTKIIAKMFEHKKKVKIYIIVTKSDLFREYYPNYEEDYEGFKNFIENKFSQNMYFKQLINSSPDVTFYPVFYYTKKVNGEHIPLRDENNNVYIFGFDKFMDSLTA